jgi:hypothetical protein
MTTLDEAEALTEVTDGIRTRETVRGMQFATRTICGTEKEKETEIGIIRAPDLHVLAALITTVHAVVAQGDIRDLQIVIEVRTKRSAREDAHGLVLGLCLLMTPSLMIINGIKEKRRNIENEAEVESERNGRGRRKRRRRVPSLRCTLCTDIEVTLPVEKEKRSRKLAMG